MVKHAHGKKPKSIIATDLDGTLVGSRTAVYDFNRHMIKNRNHFLLVYITGRIFASAWQLITKENLLYPDVLITDLGTEIYVAPRFGLDQVWERRMQSTWDAGKTRAAALGLEGLRVRELRPRFRLSFSVDRTAYQITLKRLQQLVDKEGLTVKVVPVSAEVIDLVPASAGKGLALCYVQERCLVEKEQTFVCGDSGKDLSMFIKGFKGIVVGNARPELKKELKLKNREVYFSKSYYASGILEGLKKYGVV